MELNINWQALDPKILRNMSLEEVQVQIYKRAVANVTRPELFGILMSWLNEQIKQDIITQNESLLEGFVKLLHLRNYTEIDSFSLEQVDEVFNGWLDKEAIQNPTYMRRFLITQQDVQRLFYEAKQHDQNPEDFSLSDLQPEQGGTHLLATLCKRKDGDIKTRKESTNLQQDGSHGMSLSATRDSRFVAKVELVGVDKFDQLDGLTDTSAAPSQWPSDAQSQDTDTDNTSNKKEGNLITSPRNTKMPRKSKRTSRRGRKCKAHSDVLEFSALPRNYICKRCHEPGTMTRLAAANSLTDAFNRTLDSALPNKPRSSLRFSTTT